MELSPAAVMAMDATNAGITQNDAMEVVLAEIRFL